MSTYNFDLQTNNTNLQEIQTVIINLSKQNNKLNLQEKTIVPTNEQQIAISDSEYDGLSKVIVVGDENLKSENIISGINIFGIEGNISITNENMEDNILNKNISIYTNNRVTTIGNHAFFNCSSLTSVNFPVCTSIGSGAFCSCSSLISISFPVCAIIGSEAFYNCSSLTSVNFPKCTTIVREAFANCSNLTTMNFPECTSIYWDAFYQCIKLTTVNFPACISISQNAFRDCSRLSTVNFPKCTTIGNNAFRATGLTSVSFPMCTSIGRSVFQNCLSLSQIYLMNSSVCTLSNSNAFYSTPFTGYSAYFSGTPYIYVPTSLVDAYKSATNWTYFSSYISGYSELPLEPETISIGVMTDGEYINFVSPSGYPTITVEATNEPVYCDFVLGEIYNITLYGTDIVGSGEIIYDTTVEDGQIGWISLDMYDTYATGSIVIESNIIELNIY